ncbi:hypothetical protein [Rhodococcus sp. 1168]|uniref:hypothetical protein n=1 Tax=Rhodococcus sp. 1168 TaxID=2018041 RepID=UPI000F73B011|nr:hypothetical protein [Rhodococcus sp. 1168]
MTAALRVLRLAGVVVKGGDLKVVSIIDPVEHRVRDLTWRPTTSSNILNSRHNTFERAASTLFVVETVSQDDILITAAHELKLNLVVLNPPRVLLDGNSAAPAGPVNAQVRARRLGRAAVGRWAIERALVLARVPRSQGELAQDAGLTQQAVSYALQRPLREGSVTKNPSGFIIPRSRRSSAIDNWLEEYPGALGVETYWYGLSDPVEQDNLIVRYAHEMDARALVSGDGAADHYAPWRKPASSVVYLSELLDLTAADLVPAAQREDATVTAIVPRDHTIWATAVRDGSSDRYVDPLIALWDLTRYGHGSDVDEAAAKLRAAIIDRSHP